MFRSFDFSPSLSSHCLLQMFFRAWSFTSVGPLTQASHLKFSKVLSLPCSLLDSPSSFPDAHSFLVDSMVYFCLPSRLAGIFICPFTAISLDCFGAPDIGFPCISSCVLVPCSSHGCELLKGRTCLGFPWQQDRLACCGYPGSAQFSSCGKRQHAQIDGQLPFTPSLGYALVEKVSGYRTVASVISEEEIIK